MGELTDASLHGLEVPPLGPPGSSVGGNLAHCTGGDAHAALRLLAVAAEFSATALLAGAAGSLPWLECADAGCGGGGAGVMGC